MGAINIPRLTALRVTKIFLACRRNLNRVTGIDPGAGAAGDVQKIRKTVLLENAGGSARAKTTGTNDRGWRSWIKTQMGSDLFEI